MSSHDKIVATVSVVVIFASLVLAIFIFGGNTIHIDFRRESVTEEKAQAPVPGTAHLSFVGDIMLDRGVKGKVQKYGAGDYGFLFASTDFLKAPDIMFANLEGPVSDRGYNVGSIYSFRFDPAVMGVLKDAGLDVLSMANNHIGDWTRDALEDTLHHGKRAGLQMVGGGMTYEEAIQPKIITTNGIKVGYLAFSDFGPDSIIAKKDIAQAGVLSASDPDMAKIISDASAQVDILVVSFHFGEEYQTLSNNRQKRLARAAVDAGADIVAGHHPHVAEETEVYKDKIIAYSLGNFIFDQNFSVETMRGLKLDVTVTKEGVKSYATSTIYLNPNYQPSLEMYKVYEKGEPM